MPSTLLWTMIVLVILYFTPPSVHFDPPSVYFAPPIVHFAEFQLLIQFLTNQKKRCGSGYWSLFDPYFVCLQTLVV